MAQALDRITVLEFRSHLACAYAAMLLAEQGARAIRVEPPQGEFGRGGPHFAVVNRSKLAVEIALDTPAGHSQALELVKLADVVINGFTPGQAATIDLAYESIRRNNPRAIVLNMPPLGSRGPYAELAVGDEVASAIGGATAFQGSASGNPVPLSFPLVSYQTGIIGALAATAALVARGEDGAGQALEVSMLAGALALQTGTVVRHPSLTAMLAAGRRDPMGPAPSYRLYEAADGKYLMICCVTSTFWHKLALAIGRPELVSDPRFENAPVGLTPDQRKDLIDILTSLMRSRTRAEWLDILRRHDVPCAPVLTRQEFIDDPQVRYLGMRRDVTDPTLGKTVQMGVPITLPMSPGDIAGPAPAPDDSRAALQTLLEEAARRPNPASEPLSAPDHARVKGGPLAGTFILDFTGYIAGSYSTMLLAQMGAEVVKVEPLGGDGFRYVTFGFLGWNQNKRGIAVDLRNPRSREIIHALARRADVIFENFRAGDARKMGVDYETLAALNPNVVYVSINGFGSSGPDFDQASFDPVLQARSGVMAAHDGSALGRAPIHPIAVTLPFCDYGSSSLAALGCVLALHHRQRTGRGQHCEVTLIQSAMALQAGEFIFYPGRPNLECGAPESRGAAALRRVYRCRDGRWLYVAVTGEAQFNALWAALGHSNPEVPFSRARAESSYGPLAKRLEDEFSRHDSAVALERLTDSGVPVGRVNSSDGLFDDAQLVANELLAELPHPQFGPVWQTGALLKFSATPCALRRSGPLLGEHTREVLSEMLHYSPERIEELIAQGVVLASQPIKSPPTTRS
jgi:crotonobetainyl-CoA:carnitine CoA-transferase CaiB-like acyl-CoA transferase